VGSMAFLCMGLLLFAIGDAHRLRAGPPKEVGEKLGFSCLACVVVWAACLT
jgi:hypothetical protein